MFIIIITEELQLKIPGRCNLTARMALMKRYHIQVLPRIQGKSNPGTLLVEM